MNPKPLLLSLAGMLMALQACAATPPSLHTNNWNIILVPSFETPTSGSSNLLSVTGLNHSLRFAQMLDGLVAGKEGSIQGIYALNTEADPSDLAPLLSVEPFAVLNNRAVTVRSLNLADPTAWNAPAGFIRDLIGDQPRGIYVVAAPEAMIGVLSKALGGDSSPIGEREEYAIAAGPALPLTVVGLDDGIEADADYPDLTLPRSAECSTESTTFTIDAPAGLNAYTNQTVYFVRHVEAHPTPSFEDGNYVCQGQWRALGSPDVLYDIMGKQAPDYVYGPDPENLIDCNGAACSYIRATLTVAPFAMKNGLPLTLAEYGWKDAMDLAQALFDRDAPYFNRDNGKSVLVGWEHEHIVEGVKDVVARVYDNPAAQAKLPDWPFDDYDSVWKLSTDAAGNLTFSNTCEKIPSASLPNTCPAFFPPQ